MLGLGSQRGTKKGEELGAGEGAKSRLPFPPASAFPPVAGGQGRQLCPADPVVSNSARKEGESPLGVSLSHIFHSVYQRTPGW